MSFENIQVNLVQSVDDAAELMRWLGERRSVLGFDTETEGFHWWKMNCRLAQFGDSQTGWAIPFERWGGVVAEVFERYDGPIVGHNLRFDARFMHRHGIDIGQHRCHDSMLAANALWPNERLALKDLAVRRLDAHAADGQHALDEAMAKGGWDWATVPIDLPQYWAYGALDAVLSARLHEQMMPMLAEQGLMDVYELECAVSSVLFKMETRGARIDVPFCEQKYRELTQYAHDTRAWIQSTYGISPGAKDEVISTLAPYHHFTKRTRGGSLALDEDVLSQIDHPLASAVLWVRQSEKIANTYFKNFIQLQDHGMIHSSVRQVGARTGRMSITEPALQTLPRDNKIVRNAFIPRDGHKLVSVDYKQIEMRIFAHFAQEDEMIHRIRDLGMDMHDAVAATIYGIPDGDPIPKNLRQLIKNANFAKVYGAGAKKFAQTAGITEDEGVAFYKTYDATFPGVKRFQRQVDDVARQRLIAEKRAYVRAPSGRLHVAEADTLYKCVNYLVQGTAADVLKERLIALDACGFGDAMLFPVHDEIVFDFPSEDAEEMTREVAEIMTDRTNFLVPLEVDASLPLDRWEK